MVSARIRKRYAMNVLGRIYAFYRDGFRNMDVGKSLWLIILIKLVIMFLVLRVFFFRPELSSYKTNEEKASHVIDNLTRGNETLEDDYLAN